MKAEGLTPLQILQNPQRLMVPLFQRPYVWSREAQWEPLWDDITRIAESLAADFSSPPRPHFLGAVVLQQKHSAINSLPHRIIIDGQQRLTTLQILIDAAQAQMDQMQFGGPAGRLRDLIENDSRYRQHDDEAFKLWPTNKDRDAYREVMGASPPIDYAALTHKSERIALAHKFFAESVREFLESGDEHTRSDRADALDITLRQLLKIVVIDLDADEDAQEIFETLNSRGVKLSSADLIKNFIFQRLEDDGADSEAAYDKYWKLFESSFWETEINAGRLIQPRTAVFLNHFLISRTGEVITAEQVFLRFKTYAENESGITILELLKQIHDVAVVYQTHSVAAQSQNNDLGPVDLFFYRAQVMEVEVVKSLVVYLLDPSLPKLSLDAIVSSLTHIESWLVRRSLLRMNAKAMNRLVAQLLSDLQKNDRNSSSDVIRDFLTSQAGASSYWPDDEQIRETLKTLRFYSVLPVKRIRMILEALEDHKRGIGRATTGTAEQRCPRGTLTIEHVMPQKWQSHWPLQDGETEESRRRTVQLLGNLTLLTSKLNAKVSNGPWFPNGDVSGKAAALLGQSSLLLNSQFGQLGDHGWTDKAVVGRTALLIDEILQIWPTPPGHRIVDEATETQATYVSVSDLIAAGLLESGDLLTPTWSSHAHRQLIVRSDGTLELDTGEVFDSLSGAGKRVRNARAVAGWGFWKLASSGRSLKEIRDDYRARFNVVLAEENDEESDDGGEEASDEQPESQP